MDNVTWGMGYRRYVLTISNPWSGQDVVNLRAVMTLRAFIAADPLTMSESGIDGLRIEAKRMVGTRSAGPSGAVQIRGRPTNLLIVDANRLFPAGSVKASFITLDDAFSKCVARPDMSSNLPTAEQERAGEIVVDKWHLSAGSLVQDPLEGFAIEMATPGKELIDGDDPLSEPRYFLRPPFLEASDIPEMGFTAMKLCVNW